MEADWAAEIGPELPHIHVPWAGFTDLRHNSATVNAIQETAEHPALREALLVFNSPASPVFTAKCDLWTLSQSEIDPDEFAAYAEDAHHGTASYIDLIRRDRAAFSSFEFHERWVRALTDALRLLEIPNGRVEFILRPSTVDEHAGFGLTLYAAGCGASPGNAYNAWQTVLSAAVAATINTAALPSHSGE